MSVPDHLSRVYACTTTTCPERFRGFTDEPAHCSICCQDLTEIANPNHRTLEDLNALAGLTRPRAEVEGF